MNITRQTTAYILLLVAGLSLAVQQAFATSTPGPQQLVEETSSRMLEAIRKERDTINSNPERLYQLVDEIVLPYFDFRMMSKWALGRNWNKANSEQRERFTGEFRQLLVRTYSMALSEYADEKITYLPFDGDETARTVTVKTEILYAGSSIPINYSMYNSSGGWKVYDVVISGVSLVTNYRSSFGNVIRREGMDELIRQLVDKNARGVDG